LLLQKHQIVLFHLLVQQDRGLVSLKHLVKQLLHLVNQLLHLVKQLLHLV
jgi:hypothetical protein